VNLLKNPKNCVEKNENRNIKKQVYVFYKKKKIWRHNGGYVWTRVHYSVEKNANLVYAREFLA